MWRNCIFCSADMGTNEVLEQFPVGRQVAFDASRGRLWAVCPSCARWNLAPIEERWEPVEAAEKLFRDTRMRAQSENIGLARLRDGTRLVRVGDAYEGELAAWRYGSRLLARRRKYMIASVGTTAAFFAVWGGLSAIGIGFLGYIGASSQYEEWKRQRIVHRLWTPSNEPIIVRRWHVPGISIDAPAMGELNVTIRDAHLKRPKWSSEVRKDSADTITVHGDDARSLLARAMVRVNDKGATQSGLKEANRLLEDAGGAEKMLSRIAFSKYALGKRAGGYAPIHGPAALAFEMALNEESERRALEGELAALEAAWQEAEEIAAIADSLPFEKEIRALITRRGL